MAPCITGIYARQTARSVYCRSAGIRKTAYFSPRANSRSPDERTEARSRIDMIEQNRHVVMFSAEAAPYIKVGGLGDVVGALPKALESLGLRVTVILPACQDISWEMFDIQPSDAGCFSIPVGLDVVRAEVAEATMPETGVRVFFLRGGGYFDRPGLYDDPETGDGYPDNMQRFAFYARAGIELLRRLGEPVHVIHCHDSQTALIPGLLHTVFENDPFFARTGTLFTIHNLAYQGLHEKEDLIWTGIDPARFHPGSPFEYWGKINLAKIGIETSDIVNTVSRTYAREISSGPEYGCGLEGVLRNRAPDLYGIINGIDYSEWNPESDSLIAANYSAADLSGKAICKAALQSAVGLPRSAGRAPLIGIISRLVDQKGFDLIEEAIECIAGCDLQMAILGTGQQKYHQMLETLAARNPHKVAVRLGFDNRLAHQIEAGSDMFLMPSRYEPCGLNQLYSLRYGTVPIVRSTGGLADTVTDFNPDDNSGAGFVFKKYSADQMMEALKRALAAYQCVECWQRLMIQGMRQNWSWETSAQEYVKLYDILLQKRKSN